MILGIITARQGSQGIPGKNMVDLGGRPLLDYTFALAEHSRRMDRVVLSTDMSDAIEWARRHYRRIDTPFTRPAHLAEAGSSSTDVVLHTVDFLEKEEGAHIEAIVLLQPTCPFREVIEVDGAIDLFRKKKLISLIGVSRVWHHPSDYVQRTSPEADSFRYMLRDPAWKRRQDFPEVWFITGALYICRPEYLRQTGGFCDERSYLYPMSEATMVDIDSPFDLAIARGLVATGAAGSIAHGGGK
jgi:CMP-N,N'-diacetyllegionaminic acid synthase